MSEENILNSGKNILKIWMDVSRNLVQNRIILNEYEGDLGFRLFSFRIESCQIPAFSVTVCLFPTKDKTGILEI